MDTKNIKVRRIMNGFSFRFDRVQGIVHCGTLAVKRSSHSGGASSPGGMTPEDGSRMNAGQITPGRGALPAPGSVGTPRQPEWPMPITSNAPIECGAIWGIETLRQRTRSSVAFVYCTGLTVSYGRRIPDLRLLGLTAIVVLFINIPFGYWRSRVRKFSGQWILAIHLPVPLVVACRLLLGLGWHLITFPVLVAAFLAGQFLGGKLPRISR
jgi:hypothetical protein